MAPSREALKSTANAASPAGAGRAGPRRAQAPTATLPNLWRLGGNYTRTGVDVRVHQGKRVMHHSHAAKVSRIIAKLTRSLLVPRPPGRRCPAAPAGKRCATGGTPGGAACVACAQPHLCYLHIT